MGRYSNHPDQGDRIARALSTPREPAPPAVARTKKRAHRHLTAAERALLAQAYQDGATSYVLAERYGINRVRVSRILEEQSVPRRMQSLSASQIQETAALYEEGLSIAKVAAEIGCGKGTIWKELRLAGVQLRPRPGWVG